MLADSRKSSPEKSGGLREFSRHHGGVNLWFAGSSLRLFAALICLEFSIIQTSLLKKKIHFADSDHLPSDGFLSSGLSFLDCDVSLFCIKISCVSQIDPVHLHHRHHHPLDQWECTVLYSDKSSAGEGFRLTSPLSCTYLPAQRQFDQSPSTSSTSCLPPELCRFRGSAGKRRIDKT